jgi:hypothetical protein
LEESFQITQRWIDEGHRDHLSLANLIHLFGPGATANETIRNFINSRIFYRFLSERALELVYGNKKIAKPLSYLICLEKLTSRLGNPDLTLKIQFK